jgi:hypothetical protein
MFQFRSGAVVANDRRRVTYSKALIAVLVGLAICIILLYLSFAYFVTTADGEQPNLLVAEELCFKFFRFVFLFCSCWRFAMRE